MHIFSLDLVISYPELDLSCLTDFNIQLPFFDKKPFNWVATSDSRMTSMDAGKRQMSKYLPVMNFTLKIFDFFCLFNYGITFHLRIRSGSLFAAGSLYSLRYQIPK